MTHVAIVTVGKLSFSSCTPSASVNLLIGMAAAMDVPASSLSVPTPHTKRLEGSLVAARKKQLVPSHITDTSE